MKQNHPPYLALFLSVRNRRNILLHGTIVLCSLFFSVYAAFGQIANTPASHMPDRRQRSVRNILNSDGTLQRSLPGSFDSRGYRISTGIDGAPRLFKGDNTVASALADSCGDNWDDRFSTYGLNGWVLAIAVASNGDVYAAGTFTQAGGVAANHIAKWDGLRWSALGAGTNDEIYAIAIDGADVYVGGAFTQAGGVGANRIAKWDGTSWSALGSGMNGFVAALDVTHDSDTNELILYAGGNFTSAGSVVPANRIARWNGSAWSALGVGVGTSLDDAVYALKLPFNGPQVYVGGTFSSAGGVTRTGFANWGGIGWNEHYPGVNGTVEDIAIDPFNNIFLAGTFSSASYNNIAYWNDFADVWVSPDGWGVNGSVYDIEIRGAYFPGAPFSGYAGGGFDGRIQRRTSNPDSLFNFDGGITGAGTHVSALGLGLDTVYAGGGFGTAGCRAAGNFGRYFEHYFAGSEFSGDWHDASLWRGGGVPGGSTSSVNIGSHDAAIISADGNTRDLRVDNGHSLDVGSSRTLTINRNLNINDGFITGAGLVVVTTADPLAIYGGGPNGFVSTTLTRPVNNSGNYSFPVGSGGAYGGVVMSNISGSATTSIKTNSGAYSEAASGLPANRLLRWWNIANTPPNGTLTLHYNDSEIVGNEAAYSAYKISGGVATPIPSVINTVANTVTVASTAGRWTLADSSGPPTVSTEAPTIIRLTQAELSAVVDPNGFNTTLWWRWSTVDPGTCNDSFGTDTPHYGVGSGYDPFTHSQTDGRFSPGTTYYFCAIASNSAGTVFGSVLSFTTLSQSEPSVFTNPASGLTTTEATLDANALPNGAATTGWFRYSTTDPGGCNDFFGTRAPASGGTALGSGTGVVNFTQAISGLLPSTTYYYCAIASSSLGTAFGQIVSFTTRGVRVVDRTDDVTPMGECTSAPDDCTLRGAIVGASAGDEIRFLSPLFDSPQTITLTNGIIPINRPTYLTGPGANLLTVTGSEIFGVSDGMPGSPGTLNISGIKLQGALTGAIWVTGALPGRSLTATSMIFEGNSGFGAVVLSTAAQGTFVDCTFRANTANLPFAAAIYGQFGSSVVIRGSTFYQNTGTETIRAATATIENSTVHGNSGRGLLLDGSGTLTGVTITGNGSGVSAGGTGATVRNSIIAGNGTSPAVDVAGTFTSEGFNLIGNAGAVTAFNSSGDQAGNPGTPLDPMLGALLNNGGSTFTRVPLAGSPAIDKGKAFGLVSDQTGASRTYDFAGVTNAAGGDGSDIGAKELIGPPVTAADASISGRVLTSHGRAISGALVTVQDANGLWKTSTTNTLGYYRFTDLQAGETYIVSVSARRYQFTVPTQVVSLLDSVADLNFVGTP